MTSARVDIAGQQNAAPADLRAPRDRFDAVDGIRAIAALMVVAYHGVGGPFFYSFGDEPLAVGLRGLGDFGVGLFFVLSGFLLHQPTVLAAQNRTRRGRLGGYALRRVFRIIPLYWFVLTVSLVVGDRWFDQPDGAWDTLALFGLAQSVNDKWWALGLPVAWSLSVEIMFYICVPLLARFTHRPACRAKSAAWFHVKLGLGIVVVGVGIRALVFHLSPEPSVLLYNSLVAQLHWFGAGIALAGLQVAQRSGQSVPSLIRRLGQHPWVGWCIAPFLYWLASKTSPDLWELPSATQFIIAELPWALTAVLIILPTVMNSKATTLGRRALSSFPLATLGMVSYGIYLWHLPVMEELRYRMNNGDFTGNFWEFSAIAVALTICLSAITYVLIEHPAQLLGARLAKRIRRGPLMTPPMPPQERDADADADSSTIWLEHQPTTSAPVAIQLQD